MVGSPYRGKKRAPAYDDPPSRTIPWWGNKLVVTKLGTGFVAELVAKGEAEMAVQAMSDHLAVPGVALVGPLPAEVQHYIVFTAGVGADVKDPGPAKELLTFLTAPSAVPVLKAKGLEPGSSP
jgi:ABC-type molybdate transport system substrate-binding protein